MTTPQNARPADDRLMDEIRQHIAFIDKNRPSTPALWLLLGQLQAFRDFAEWQAKVQQEERVVT